MRHKGAALPRVACCQPRIAIPPWCTAQAKQEPRFCYKPRLFWKGYTTIDCRKIAWEALTRKFQGCIAASAAENMDRQKCVVESTREHRCQRMECRHEQCHSSTRLRRMLEDWWKERSRRSVTKEEDNCGTGMQATSQQVLLGLRLQALRQKANVRLGQQAAAALTATAWRWTSTSSGL